MKKRFYIARTFLISFMAFIPPLIKPLSFFLEGDPDVISIKTQETEPTHYRLPANNIGVRVIKKVSDNKKYYMLVANSEETFNRYLYPPTELDISEGVSILDEEFLALLKTELRKRSLYSSMNYKDIIAFLSAIDTASLIRSGREPLVQKRSFNDRKVELNRFLQANKLDDFKLETSIITRSVR